MKTIQDIKNEIKECKQLIGEAESKFDRKSKTLAKKLRAELVKLNQYKLFLETAPTEDSCKRAAEKLSLTIAKIVSDYNLQFGTLDYKPKIKKNFLKDRRVPKLRQQLSQLNYLLS